MENRAGALGSTGRTMTNIPSPTLDSSSSLGELLDGALDGVRSELLCALQELVRIPSENCRQPEMSAHASCTLRIACASAASSRTCTI